MRRLLVPVDGSANALRAVQHVIGLAKREPDLALFLVTGHDASLGLGITPDHLPMDRVAELQRTHGERVLAPAEALLRGAGLPYTREILVGPVGPTIARRAAELGCDAIVMGTRGMTAMRGLLLGSVSTQVVHLADVPVTLVK